MLGITGPTGSRGLPGIIGPTGRVGGSDEIRGPIGATGITGPTGATGPRGKTGHTQTGPIGPIGPDGIDGKIGATGHTGNTGNRGPSSVTRNDVMIQVSGIEQNMTPDSSYSFISYVGFDVTAIKASSGSQVTSTTQFAKKILIDISGSTYTVALEDQIDTLYNSTLTSHVSINKGDRITVRTESIPTSSNSYTQYNVPQNVMCYILGNLRG
jgi:hypothetical protein